MLFISLKISVSRGGGLPTTPGCHPSRMSPSFINSFAAKKSANRGALGLDCGPPVGPFRATGLGKCACAQEQRKMMSSEATSESHAFEREEKE